MSDRAYAPLPADEVFRVLTGRGVARVEVRFSGGNDEGGVDEITLFDAAGAECGTIEEPHWRHEWDDAAKAWVPAEPKPADYDLVSTLCAPVYGRWGSFAGDFSVSGTLTWDAATKRAYFEGSETEYVPFLNTIHGDPAPEEDE